MIFSTEYYSYMYSIIITMQGFGIVGNSFIFIVFLKTLKLRKNKSLYLVNVLCVTNSLFSLSALPFTVYQFIMIRNNTIIYNPFLLAVASTPTMIDFKFNLIITIMVAIDRVQAIKFPMFYRNKNHMKFVCLTVAIGLSAGLADTVLGILTIDYSMKIYKCFSVGCFQTIVFPIYWSSSNMILEIILFVLTFVMIFELSQRMKTKKSQATRQTNLQKNNAAANRLSLGILLTSFIFLFIPSILLVIDEILDINLFKLVGPFYTIGLIITSLSNSILYITLHNEIKEATITMIFRKSNNKAATDGSTNPVTILK